VLLRPRTCQNATTGSCVRRSSRRDVAAPRPTPHPVSPLLLRESRSPLPTQALRGVGGRAPARHSAASSPRPRGPPTGPSTRYGVNKCWPRQDDDDGVVHHAEGSRTTRAVVVVIVAAWSSRWRGTSACPPGGASSWWRPAIGARGPDRGVISARRGRPEERPRVICGHPRRRRRRTSSARFGNVVIGSVVGTLTHA